MHGFKWTGFRITLSLSSCCFQWQYFVCPWRKYLWYIEIIHCFTNLRNRRLRRGLPVTLRWVLDLRVFYGWMQLKYNHYDSTRRFATGPRNQICPYRSRTQTVSRAVPWVPLLRHLRQAIYHILFVKFNHNLSCSGTATTNNNLKTALLYFYTVVKI